MVLGSRGHDVFQVFVGPGDEARENRGEAPAELGDLVLDSWGNLGVARRDTRPSDRLRAARDVALPVVDPTDIASVAVSVLRERGHIGRTYELTGPEAITPRAQAAAIGTALRESIEFVELSRRAARAQMVEMLPEQVTEATLDVIGTPRPHEQRVSQDVEAVLGRAPRTYQAWVEATIGAFR